jgi:hypothetical protein
MHRKPSTTDLNGKTIVNVALENKNVINNAMFFLMNYDGIKCVGHIGKILVFKLNDKYCCSFRQFGKGKYFETDSILATQDWIEEKLNLIKI